MPWINKQRADGMLEWEPTQWPQELLDEFLDCLRLPLERRQAGASALSVLLSAAQDMHSIDEAEPKREEAREQLAQLAQKTAAYRIELDKLGDVARVWLGLHDYRRDYFGEKPAPERRFQTNDLVEVMDGIGQARARYKFFCCTVDQIHVASSEDYWEDFRPSRKGGRPRNAPGGPYESGFDRWMRLLWWTNEKEGWRLTVSPHNKTGSVIKLLRLAAPHLPSGFVPGDSQLSLDRLRRLREKSRGRPGTNPHRKK